MFKRVISAVIAAAILVGGISSAAADEPDKTPPERCPECPVCYTCEQGYYDECNGCPMCDECYEESRVYKPGDISGSDKLEMSDALQILRYLVKLSSQIVPPVMPLCVDDCVDEPEDTEEEPAPDAPPKTVHKDDCPNNTSPLCMVCRAYKSGTAEPLVPGNKSWYAAASIGEGDNVQMADALQVLRWLVALSAPNLETHWGKKKVNRPPPSLVHPGKKYNIEQYNSPNFLPHRGPEDNEDERYIPDMIVMHTTGGKTTSGVNTIMNPKNEVSYHFIIDEDGTIMQFVDIEHWAFANGTNNDPDSKYYHDKSALPIVRERFINANWYTVAISFGNMQEGNPTPEQLDAVIWLIHHIRYEVERVYGKIMQINRDTIVGHREVMTATDCPGDNFPYDEIIRRVNESVPVKKS